MVDRYLANYYPKEPIDGEQPEAEAMSGFKVMTAKVNESTTKVYVNDELELYVWTAQYCKQKVTKLINSDEDHAAWTDKVLNWQEKESAKSEMHKRWAADCWTIMAKVYAAMMENPEKYRQAAPAAPASTSETAAPASSQPSKNKQPTGLFSNAKKGA